MPAKQVAKKVANPQINPENQKSTNFNIFIMKFAKLNTAKTLTEAEMLMFRGGSACSQSCSKGKCLASCKEGCSQGYKTSEKKPKTQK
ncbi:hypothetical protein FACS1894180_0280 [Bacteroidia bacterium]|nr:hypothetical protein FACS1894178_5720 [Bacteroidia bacterium]GHV42841.1 hypothetical protein FACS1894180_0280 [Bacteroidia bacterium]